MKTISRAKLNLFLHIIGRNAQQYHLIESLMVFAELCDEIELYKAQTLQVNFTDQAIDKENTVTRVIKLFSQYYNVQPNFHITITKNIPIAAGLGGGSGNAAAVIRFLCQFYNLPIDDKVYEIAQKVGLDTMICLKDTPCFVSGIGEELTPVPELSLELPIVIVNCGKALLAKDMYQTFKASNRPFSKSKTYTINKNNLLEELYNTRNDLYETAVRTIPQIRESIDVLRKQRQCLIARMSGSGPSCFGIFTDKESTYNATCNIKKIYPKWLVQQSFIYL